jgi:RimJ/RimL family protein N-acetyltransferase
MTDPVQIRTVRLLLRPFTPTDLEALQTVVWGDPMVTKYLPGGRPRTLDETQKIIDYYVGCWDRPTEAIWGVVRPDTGCLIGQCGLKPMSAPAQDVEILYALAVDSWGLGYATEVARACLRFGFEDFDCDHLRAVAVPENTASRRVMEKLGMTCDGLFPSDKGFDENLAFYSLARASFDPGDHPYAVTDSE